jgi:MFS family permease
MAIAVSKADKGKAVNGKAGGHVDGRGAVKGSSPAQRAGFRDLFALGEFRALWASQVLSVAGDRLALVALTILIYDRTKSPLMAAIAFAAGTLPYIVGALFLAGLADRFPRRTVMVVTDVARMLLVAAMLVPGMSLYALIALLYAVTTFQPVFDAARSAILRDIVPMDKYALSAGMMQSTFRVLIVAGAAGAGAMVALAGARWALAADAVSFAVSALIVQSGLRARPAASPASGIPGEGAEGAAEKMRGPLRGLAGGAAMVFGDKALRTLVLIAWLSAFYEVPEGIGASYAGKLGGGPVAAGLLIASTQIGSVVAMPYFTKRVGPLTQLRWMGPMAVCACLALVLTVLRPNFAVSMAIFLLSNTFAVYQIAANTAFVQRIPNERRAQAFGLANAGLVIGQGIGYAVAGAAAEVVPPSTVVALAGGLGALVAAYLAFQWRRIAPTVGRHSARHLSRQLTRQQPGGDPPGNEAMLVLREPAPVQLVRSRG